MCVRTHLDTGWSRCNYVRVHTLSTHQGEHHDHHKPPAPRPGPSTASSFPPPGTWDIDPGHADVAFTGRHLMLTKVRGRFHRRHGQRHGRRETMSDSTVDVTIGMASVESGSSARDEHLRSAELFDVEKFPEATFRSVSVDWHGNGGVVHGDLTIHGTTRRVPLQVTFEGYVRDPWGADRAIFSARHQGQPRGLRHHLEHGPRGRRRPREQGGQDHDRHRDRPELTARQDIARGALDRLADAGVGAAPADVADLVEVRVGDLAALAPWPA